MSKILEVNTGEVKILMEVIGDFHAQYETRQLFSLGVVGLTPVDRRKKTVKWDKYTCRRIGDNFGSSIRFSRVLESAPDGTTVY